MSVRRAHLPLKKEMLPQDFFIERKWRHVDAWDGHDLLLDANHHASSHTAMNTISVLLRLSFFLYSFGTDMNDIFLSLYF